MGYGCGWPQLGLWCALGAAITAYVRVLGASLGTPHFFFGPMAKQHRMGLATLSLLVSIHWAGILPWTLGVMLVGTLLTSALRAKAIVTHLETASSADRDQAEPNGRPGSAAHQA